MSVAQVLAELGVHDLQRQAIPLTVKWGTSETRTILGDPIETRFPMWTWADWRCCCGFRATVEHAIPEDMVQRWHDEAVTA